MKIRVINKGSVSKDGTQSYNIKCMESSSEIRRYIKEVAKISLIVENKLRRAQNIEWVMSGGKVWVLQSRISTRNSILIKSN